MTMKRILIWSLVILLFLNHTALVYADEVSEAGRISESDEISELDLQIVRMCYNKHGVI